MMISPESYYNMHIKGNNKSEILKEIRSLKRRINCLKETIEHPDYNNKIHSFPTESTQLYWLREYLEKAKEGLAEIGEEYIPTKAEQKTEKFQKSIPFIQKLIFEHGGFHRGYETKVFRFDENHLYMDVEHSLILKPTNLYIEPDHPMTKDVFLEGLKELHIGGWRRNYNTDRFGYRVCDGTQWSLEIYFSNEHKPVKFYGDNAYPYNLDALLALLGCITNGEDELYTKKFEILTDYIIKMKTDTFRAWIRNPLESNTENLELLIIGHSTLGEFISAFERDIYDFDKKNPEYQLNRYGNILEQNNLKWDKESMENATEKELDAQCVLALILGAIRADRFSHGILLQFFENGAILRWLERLKEIDDEEWDRSFTELNPF